MHLADITYGFFLILPFIVFLAGAFDLYTYHIPNILSLVLIVGFYIFALLSPNMSWEMIGFHTLTGAGALVICFILFCLGLFGGGDAKIFASSALWIGHQDLLNYFIAVTAAGGVLSIFVLLFRANLCYPLILKVKWLSSLYFGNGTHKNAIPYAVAIAAGLFFTLHNTSIFQAAILTA